jgi:hypothetical protein
VDLLASGKSIRWGRAVLRMLYVYVIRLTEYCFLQAHRRVVACEDIYAYGAACKSSIAEPRRGPPVTASGGVGLNHTYVMAFSVLLKKFMRWTSSFLISLSRAPNLLWFICIQFVAGCAPSGGLLPQSVHRFPTWC